MYHYVLVIFLYDHTLPPSPPSPALVQSPPDGADEFILYYIYSVLYIEISHTLYALYLCRSDISLADGASNIFHNQSKSHHLPTIYTYIITASGHMYSDYATRRQSMG